MLEILGAGSGERGLNRVKPGLLFLLRLAWESRARLPLLIMSGFMALGVRVQMEINIERAASFMPRLRLQEEELAVSDSEEGSDWTTDDAGFDSEDYEEDDDEEEDEDDEEEDEDYT